MGLLDSISTDTPEAETETYAFASTGIGGYLNELKAPKQAQDIREDDNLEDLEDLQPEQKPEPLEKLQATNAVANASASLLTIALDSSLSAVFGYIAGEEASNYKADEDQREELEKAISEYVKLKGGDIPPGIALLILVVSSYGGKGAMAFQVRKLNKESAEKDKLIAEMRAKIDALELKE